jgi:uncharacterized membrane protein YkoI
MHPVKGMLTLAVLVAAVALPARAQQPRHPMVHAARPYRREVPRRLLARTRISEDSALKVAMARIPGARVQALELENEKGHLIWSWEMKIAGKSGIEEVNVDALDGSIVGVEHESPGAEGGERPHAAPKPKAKP